MKIIALITTTGERNIEKSLESIKNQITAVDKIIIASEKSIKSKKIVMVNPFKKGLARNTMQALIKIRLKNEGKIFIATLDDDDEWMPDYITDAKRLIKNGYNFISGDMDVYDNGNLIGKFTPRNITYRNFLTGNPGIQGSNKIFDLDLALESGGMPMEINASTDRAFNINMLLHPECRLGIIQKTICEYHQDKNRKRITNDLKRIGSLRRFYKHFDHLLTDDDITAINKRHKKLHGFNKVIEWR